MLVVEVVVLQQLQPLLEALVAVVMVHFLTTFQQLQEQLIKAAVEVEVI
jgi:hypothetical protein